MRLGTALIIGSLGSVGMWSVVVVIPAVQGEFGATRAAASLAFTCAMLGFGAGGVGMGKMSDRFGIVPAIGLGILALAIGYIGAGYSTALWQFNLMHFAIGLGAAATFGPLMAEASHWFEKYRGLAVTIAASGNYVAGTFWPTVVERGTAYAGWRATHIAIGIGCSLLMMVIVAILRWQIGDEKVRTHENAPPPRVDLRLSTNALTILLCIASVGCCVAMAMPQVHIVAYCGDLGYGVARGAEMLSLMMLLGIVSRIGSGFVADRIGGTATLALGSLMQGVALFLYLWFDGLSSLYIVSGLFGLFQGGIVPMYAIVIREYLPARQAGVRIGLVMSVTVLGMATGGYLSGVIFDYFSSYRMAFLNGLAWNLVNLSVVCWLMLRTRSRSAQGVQVAVR
jgi:MFS family permease